MINLYQLDKTQPNPLTLPDMSSLDAITRQLPDGYYSTFRTFAGCTRVLGLKAHLRRLPDVDVSALRRSLLQLLEPFRAAEARIRLILTYDKKLYIAIEPLKLLPREVYEQGVRVETTEIQRNSPHLKSTAFIGDSEEERKHLANEGIFEALLVKNGKVLEGMTSNFFYVGQIGSSPYLGTARNRILLGVTRRIVIRVARRRGLEVKYQPLELNQLSAVKEAFITSSSRGIVPVIQIDEVLIGQGRVGPITKQLMLAYDEAVLKLSEKI
jgi:branched-chain amino acid aminotransferase